MTIQDAKQIKLADYLQSLVIHPLSNKAGAYGINHR